MTEAAIGSVLGYQVDNGVAWLRLNRPQRRNAIDEPLRRALAEAIKQAERAPEVRALVVVGEGQAFCAGADVREFQERTGAVEEIRGDYEFILQRLHGMPKPTIAAVNGFALGGGCELALACDIRYASSGAKLGQPEVNLGIIPGWGGTQRLARVCGLGVAKELIFTGRTVGAEEALRVGLVNALHDPVLDKATETATLLATKSPVALRAMKGLANRALAGDHSENLRAEGETFGELFSSDDAKEGLAAFVEKREPVFKGT
jgi:enoyl-CoA hydratase